MLKTRNSPKFDQLQNVPLTQSRSHDAFSSKKSCWCLILPLTHFLNFPLAAKVLRPPFQPSHWSSKCMAHYNFLLLIIIPGIHSLARLAMTRSLIILLKPCSICWNLFFHIVMLYLFFHYTSMFVSYPLHAKIHQLRDYFMLIIVRLTWQWPTTALMLCTKLDSLPLFQ